MNFASRELTTQSRQRKRARPPEAAEKCEGKCESRNSAKRAFYAGDQIARARAMR